MRLCRYEQQGAIKTGIVFGERVVEIHALLPELVGRVAPGDMKALLQEGRGVLNKLAEKSVASASLDGTPISELRLLAPIDNPAKIICSWVNYYNPVMAKLPDQPIFFSKYNSAIVGPGDDIRLPRSASDIVVEPEMTVVIGKRGRDIEEAEAMGYVGGYTIVNDVTAFSHRLQILVGATGPYGMAKTFDTFAPMGPWITTSEDVPDPHDLDVRQYLNGDLRTSANTSAAVFKIPALISYLSKFFELQPGDLILTGSPPPNSGKPDFLSPGDRVRIEIGNLGTLESSVIAA